jgi:hypothetical protein
MTSQFANLLGDRKQHAACHQHAETLMIPFKERANVSAHAFAQL